VFTRIDGDPIQPDSVTRIFARIVAKAKIRPISFHQLRHTHTTDLLRRGPPEDRSGTPGQATIAITMDIYSHAIPGLQEEAAQRIDAALRSAMLRSKGGNLVAKTGFRSLRPELSH
jgi:integrase